MPMRYTRPTMSHRDEEMELIKKLLKSVFGIILVLTITIGTLELFGPKIFSIFGLLSLERFKKQEKAETQTPTPIIVDIDKFTKNKKLSVSGFTESDSQVKLFVNGPEINTTTSDSEGKFDFYDIELIEGTNSIFVKAIAKDKTESDKSQTVTINLDLKAPKIQLEKPKEGEEFASVDSRITVKGTVDEKATINVNEHLTVVDADGNFQTLIGVKEGENKIRIIAKDEAGNEATASVKINFKKR